MCPWTREIKERSLSGREHIMYPRVLRYIGYINPWVVLPRPFFFSLHYELFFLYHISNMNSSSYIISPTWVPLPELFYLQHEPFFLYLHRKYLELARRGNVARLTAPTSTILISWVIEATPITYVYRPSLSPYQMVFKFDIAVANGRACNSGETAMNTKGYGNNYKDYTQCRSTTDRSQSKKPCGSLGQRTMVSCFHLL